MKIAIITIIINLIIITNISPTFALEESSSSAHEVNIGYSRINPTSLFYFLKTIRENLEMEFAQTSKAKDLRRLEFATRRLREVKTLVSLNNNPASKEQDLIPPTLERYIYHLDSLTQNHLPNDDFVPLLQNELIVHLAVLREIYDQASSKRARIFIRSAINRLAQRSDLPVEAKLSACNFFAKEASSSALNQTEQFVLRVRAKNCL